MFGFDLCGGWFCLGNRGTSWFGVEALQFIVTGACWEGVVVNLSKVSEEDITIEGYLASCLIIEPK